MGTKKGFAFIKFGLNKHKFLGVGSIGQRYNYKGICAKSQVILRETENGPTKSFLVFFMKKK